MTSAFTETWLNNVVESINLPAVSPETAKIVLPTVDMQIRKVIQQAYKFYKHSKTRYMTVDDINLSLSLNKVERVYGINACTSSSLSSSSSSASFSNFNTKIKTAEMVVMPTLSLPLQADVSLHWLAVDGIQPTIPENPTIRVADELNNLPESIEPMKRHFYQRVTSTLLACDALTLREVYTALKSDHGMQELLPNISHFIYHNIKSTKNITLLLVLNKAIYTLTSNPSIKMHFYLQQLVPAILSCIIRPKLGSSSSVSTSDGNDDHWTLRMYAANLIAFIIRKYSHHFPDLQARVCKTYLTSLEEVDLSLKTLYGCIYGLYALGHAVIKSLLLPKTDLIALRIAKYKEVCIKKETVVIGKKGNSRYSDVDSDVTVTKCKTILLQVLGTHMVYCMKLPVIHQDTVSNIDAHAGEGESPMKKRRVEEQQQLRPTADVGTKKDLELFDLEEALAPYYSLASVSIQYCNLFI